jgi:signal transduction histidine kinase
VDQLVTEVDDVIRTARHHGRRGPARCDAAEVVRARSRFWAVPAAAQGRAVDVQVADGPATVAVDAAALGAALDVLVDNVFRHTAPGTGFALVVRATATEVTVAVVDRGSGLADEALAVRGVSGSGSTGLGLDVARRTAEAAGGRLTTGRGPQGGAQVALVLPHVAA